MEKGLQKEKGEGKRQRKGKGVKGLDDEREKVEWGNFFECLKERNAFDVKFNLVYKLSDSHDVRCINCFGPCSNLFTKIFCH